ncbi:MAG: alpha/beta hydrolase [Pseudomonadales bacterium]|nr:alpha/beta hydrolase [Pseudomonadales bacterium]
MPIFKRQGVNIHYDIVGDTGDWIVLTPGGRNPMEDVRFLADALSKEGYRVLIHDRRNCGKSDVSIVSGISEQEMWAEDVYALLDALDAFPVIAGGVSAGCRLSLLLATRYPDQVKGLLVWWVTGGRYAADFLGEQYYGQFKTAAEVGGMAAVCETEFFAERIQENPGNRDILMNLEVGYFTSVMQEWRDYFDAGADLPVIGATEEELRAIKVPTCIIPGSDDVHPRAVAVKLQTLIGDSQLCNTFDKADLPRIKKLPLDEIMVEARQRFVFHFVNFVRQQQAAGHW